MERVRAPRACVPSCFQVRPDGKLDSHVSAQTRTGLVSKNSRCRTPHWRGHCSTLQQRSGECSELCARSGTPHALCVRHGRNRWRNVLADAQINGARRVRGVAARATTTRWSCSTPRPPLGRAPKTRSPATRAFVGIVTSDSRMVPPASRRNRGPDFVWWR